MEFEQSAAVAVVLPPERMELSALLSDEHADSHCSKVPARGRREAVAADGG